MLRVTRWLPLLSIALSAGCGGDDDGGEDLSLPPLSQDPAVDTGCSPAAPPAGAVRAKPVACAEELPSGRLVSGRVGDLLLENARVKVVIRGAGEGYYMYGTSGGGLVDAARAGGEDLIKEIQPTVGLNAGAYQEIVITEAGDDGPAEIVVRGRATPLPLLDAILDADAVPVIIEHHWRLAADADELELITIARKDPEAPADGQYQLVDGLFTGGRVAIFVPELGFTGDGTSSGELIASAGTSTSYGLVLPSGNAQLLDISGVKLAFGPSLTAGKPEGQGAKTRWLVIGDGSVASVTERAWALRGVATGVISGTAAAGVDVEVRAAGTGGELVTIARADGSGGYRVAVPAGDYQLRASSLARAPAAEVAVTVAAGGQAQADLPVGAAGALLVRAREAGQPVPARVTIEGNGERRIEYVGASGEALLPLRPGSWRVSVSRGMEYDAVTVDPLVVAADGQAELNADLVRVVDTSGWIAVDTHLHSEMSTDSSIPLEDRLLAVAAEGVEVPISTDHDFVTDYAPVIDDLGLGAWMHSLVGEEASSVVWGHLNAWPLTVELERGGQGAVPWYDRSPGEVFDLLRDNDAARIVQVNHPRKGGSGLFLAIDLDPVTLNALADPVTLGLPPGTDLNDFDFDAVEVANDFGGEEFELALGDWLALVGAGHHAAATGSSDSHGRGAFAGNSRTYVYVGDGNDDPTTIDAGAVGDGIRARRVVVAQGAFVVAGLVDPSTMLASLPGDTLSLPGATAQVTLRISVQAPPWMPLSRIRIYRGSQVIREIPLDPLETAPERFLADVDLAVTPGADTFFVVRVDPAGDGDPVFRSTPDGSFTNPLLLDLDGDGMFAP